MREIRKTNLARNDKISLRAKQYLFYWATIRVKDLRYLLYSTRALTGKYFSLGRKRRMSLCVEIIAMLSGYIQHRQCDIDFRWGAGSMGYRYHKSWCSMERIPPIPQEEYFGHPVDFKTERLVSYACASHENVILIDH